MPNMLSRPAAVLVGSLLISMMASPAAAKGPEAVRIEGPAIDVELDMESVDRALMATLMEQTGIWFGIGDLPVPTSEPTDVAGVVYTVSWVNMGPPGTDMEVRTIRQDLLVQVDRTILIYTPDQPSLSGWGAGVTGWFLAPVGLSDTLEALGVGLVRRSAAGWHGRVI